MDLSIVVPVFNEEDFVEGCLEAIFSSLENSGIEYEVIVVNNGSTDATLSVLSDFNNVRCFDIERSTVAYARNFGADKATGEVLAFIDGDVLITNEWVTTMELFIEGRGKAKLDALTGFQCKSRAEGSWIERYWFSGIESSHINSGNLIVSKSGFNYLKGFNEQLKTGEDVDICERAKSSDGINFQKNRGFVAIHLDYPRTLKRFFLRELWHGEGDFKNARFFLKSKVALVSCIYGGASILALLFILAGETNKAIVSLAFIVTFNLLLAVYRFRGESLKAVLVCSFLNYIYFLARFLSIFTSAYKRNRKF